MKKNYKRILAVLVMAAITLFGSLTVISAEEVADAPTAEVENTEEGEHTGTVAVLAAQLKESVPEILTAASLVVSLVLAFIYKKGLLPTLSAALTRLSGGIGEISKRAEESNEGARQMSEALAERLKQAEQTVDAISESLSAVTAMLEERRNDKNTAEMLNWPPSLPITRLV